MCTESLGLIIIKIKQINGEIISNIKKIKFPFGGGSKKFGKPHENPKPSGANTSGTKERSLVPIAIKYEITPKTKKVTLKKIDYVLLNKQVDIFESLLHRAIIEVKAKRIDSAKTLMSQLNDHALEFESAFSDLRDFVAEKAATLSSIIVPDYKTQEKILSLVSNFEKLSLRFVKYKDVLGLYNSQGIEALARYNNTVINTKNYLQIYSDFQNVPKMLNPKLHPEIQGKIAEIMFETTRRQREALKNTKLPRFVEEMKRIEPTTEHGVFRPPTGYYDAYVVELVDAIAKRFGGPSEERRECVIDSLLNIHNNLEFLYNHYEHHFLVPGDRLPSNLMAWANEERRLILEELRSKQNALSEFLNREVGIRYNPESRVWQRSGSYKIGRVQY